MPTRTLAIEIPEPLFQQVEALSAATARSESEVVLDALMGHVALESWQLEDIRAGQREAEAGEFASAEEVKAVFARYGA
jgi:RHH-type transcriptional regulator, rel operon repressor / antitoxin RelB